MARIVEATQPSMRTCLPYCQYFVNDAAVTAAALATQERLRAPGHLCGRCSRALEFFCMADTAADLLCISAWCSACSCSPITGRFCPPVRRCPWRACTCTARNRHAPASRTALVRILQNPGALQLCSLRRAVLPAICTLPGSLLAVEVEDFNTVIKVGPCGHARLQSRNRYGYGLGTI